MDNNNGLLNSYNETLKISGYEIRSFIDPLLAYEDTNLNLRKYSLLNTDFIIPKNEFSLQDIHLIIIIKKN